MALRCVDEHGVSTEAAALTGREWTSLGRPPRRQLRLPCCRGKAARRTSRGGTRFFAHRTRDGCNAKPETEVHRVLKLAALRAARRAGWTAQTEVRGTSPDGEGWMADVLAEKDGRRLAIEIEWPRQDTDELWNRHHCYKQSGVEAVWMLRQPGFPISAKLPAVCIGGDLEGREGLAILMPEVLCQRAGDRAKQWMWPQVTTPRRFAEGVFDGRFLFGLQPAEGSTARLGIKTKGLECQDCGHHSLIVSSLVARIGPHEVWRGLGLADDVPRLQDRIRDAIAGHRKIGELRTRPSEDRRRGRATTTENSCAHCGRTFTGLDELSAYLGDGDTLAEVELELDEKALSALKGHGETWAIWDKVPKGPHPPEAR